ncbi:MAG: PAS domain S-box protein, partial [Spirochaetia bacterium]
HNQDISLILMDIDLGSGIDGTEAAQIILEHHNLPIVFLTSHSEKEVVDKVKGISRYGYVLKFSGEFVLVEAVTMALELFEAHQATKTRELQQQQQMEELSAIYSHTPALMVLLDAELKVRKANSAAAEFAHSSAEGLLNNRIGESLRCLNHLNHPQGCGFGPHCRQCTIRTTVLSTFKTKKPHTRVEASIPVQQAGEDGEASFFLSTVYLSMQEEPTVLVSIEDTRITKSDEEKIIKSAGKYRSLFNSIRDAILVADTQRTIIDCNPAFTDLFGYRLDEIRGKQTLAVYDNMDEFARMGEAIESHTGSLSEFLFTVHYQKKDGSVFPGETNVFYLHDGKGEVIGFIGLIRDISERLRMETELKQQEENLRLTLNSIGDAVFSTNTQGQVMRMNPVAEQLTGWDLPSAQGQPIDEIFHIVNAENNQRIDDPVAKVLATGTVSSLSNHTKLISKTGQNYHIADSAAPITTEDGNIEGVVLVFRDITEKYYREQRLRESEEKYRNLFDNAPIGIFQTNSGGQTLHVNNALAKMLQAVSPEEALARYQDLGSQLYVNPRRREELLSLLKEEGHVENFEFQAHTLQNEQRWLSMNARVSAELNDGTLIIDGFTFDITEQKQAHDKIRSALEEKQNLMKEMNHRVKNNLAMVASLISLKESSAEYSIDLSDVINQIHAIKLVHERLYSTEDATHIDLHTYLKEILNSIFSSFPETGVQLETDIESILVPSTIAVSLGLITNEIATNAVKYGFGSTAADSFKTSLHEAPKGSGNFVYTLSNSGPAFPEGIDPATADSLGLQLITLLVDQIRGTLKLQKEPHPIFTIRFSVQQ